MRLDINLATRPYEDAGEFWRKWGAGLIALGVVTLVLVSYTLWGWYRAHGERASINSIKQSIDGMDQKLARARDTLAKPENQAMRQRSDYLNGLFQQKAFSWTNVFEELERVMPPRLHVVSIKPEITRDNQLEIKLVVAGDSSDRARELVRKMEDSKRFQRTRIDQETSRNTPGVGEETQFEISALYATDFDLGRKETR
jgi:type IV pilus assembly protein PilN